MTLECMKDNTREAHLQVTDTSATASVIKHSYKKAQGVSSVGEEKGKKRKKVKKKKKNKKMR